MTPRVNKKNAHFTARYRPEQLQNGIVHIGVGAFHRAHQAHYLHRWLDQHPDQVQWGCIGASLMRPTVAEQLNPQDGLYHLIEKDQRAERMHCIGSIRKVLPPQARDELLAVMSEPSVHIVSLTVTEKAYQSADLLDVLWTPLQRRWQAGMSPFTILCCDNLPQNGRIVRRLLLDGLPEGSFKTWLRQHLRCPSSMIDRIVPATTEADRLAFADAKGLQDEALVVAEPFSQWVIEDDFSAARPSWEDVGVTMVDDVTPHEEMKLRLLNGCHSALAYIGYLSGFTHMSDVLADPLYERFASLLLERNIAPTVDCPAGVDLMDYQSSVLRRFSNPMLHHRCHQIAMDGSQKLPQRLLNTLRDQWQQQGSTCGLSLSLAAWMIYATGRDLEDKPIVVQDPLAPTFREIAGVTHCQPEAMVDAFLAIKPIFADGLPNRQEMIEWLNLIFRVGIRSAVQRCVEDLSRSTVTTMSR